MDAEQQTRLCTSCATWRPVNAFRLRRSGSERRHHQCASCAAGYMRRWRAARRLRTVGHVLVHLHRYRDDCPSQLENLAALVVAAFNGPSGFLASYRAALDAAQAAGDRRAVQRLLAGVFDFVTAAETAAARRTVREAKRQQRRANEQRRAAQRRRRDDRDGDIDPAWRAEIEAEAGAKARAWLEMYERALASGTEKGIAAAREFASALNRCMNAD